MSILTIAPTNGDQHKNPDYYAGRADAYDENRAGADAETLEDRFEWMSDPTSSHNPNQLVSTAYLQGYLALIQDLRAEQHWTRYVIGLDYAAWLEATQ